MGLCYTRFRWFDAHLGRWCSPDPMGLGGGPNLLAFNAAPTAGVDPLGLACDNSVYVLRDASGDIVYVGITCRNPPGSNA